MAAGLELLGPELLGRVLELLPRGDLRAARLAARIFDEASRKHTRRAGTLHLTTYSPAFDGGRGPCWARFPRLRRLVMGYWRAGDLPMLCAIMDGGGAEALGGIEEVSLCDYPHAGADAHAWAAALRWTPRVAALRLGAPPLAV